MGTIDAAQIRKFAVYADAVKNGGNGNKIVDTPEEIEVFKKKCKTAGFDGVDDVMDTYNKDKWTKEADYEAKGTTSDSSVETAVIAAMTENTALRSNNKSGKDAKSISAGLQEEAGWWDNLWGNNDELAEYANLIDTTNVVDVVKDDESINALNEASDETKVQIIEVLLAAAQEKQVDVSNLVMVTEDGYKVGRDVPGGSFGEDVTGSRSLGEWIKGEDTNFSAVVKAIRQALQTSDRTVNGENDNKEEMLTTIARRIDADEQGGGNGNGYIDTNEEKEAFKQFAATKGYDVDKILEEIADNEANGVENTTEAQRIIYNIFDPTQKAAYEKFVAGKNADIAELLKKGFEKGDTDIVLPASDMINEDNVVEILDMHPNFVYDLNDAMDWEWVDRYDYKSVYPKVVDALIARAESEGIEVSDLVIKLNDEEYSINGKKVACCSVWSDNELGELITKLQERIKSEEL